jgi:hypothetical protein
MFNLRWKMKPKKDLRVCTAEKFHDKRHDNNSLSSNCMTKSRHEKLFLDV